MINFLKLFIPQKSNYVFHSYIGRDPDEKSIFLKEKLAEGFFAMQYNEKRDYADKLRG